MDREDEEIEIGGAEEACSESNSPPLLQPEPTSYTDAYYRKPTKR